MGQRIEGKRLVKHSPNLKIQSELDLATTFLIKANSSFIASIKQINKKLDKFNKCFSQSKKYQNNEYKSVKYITVKGMGKSMEKCLNIGMFYQDSNYRVDILTGSIQVLDEFKDEELTESQLDNPDLISESTYKKRMVSLVEIRIWLKRD